MIDGALLLDKPLGLSSNAALQNAKRLYGAAKAGHAGTLDPLASGLLMVLFGEATKFAGPLLDADKEYLAALKLGQRTSTGDAEGAVLQSRDVSFSQETLAAVLERFRGEIEQVPPMHSALKFQGQRLYELARRGESVERAPRRITIHSVERRKLDGDRLEFEVSCSKGTYIRSLAADIANRLGTLGYLAGLRRLSVDPFAGAAMYTLEDLEARRSQEGEAGLDQLLLGADFAFGDLSSVHLDAEATRTLLLGQTARGIEPAGPGTARAYDSEGRFLGLVEGQPDGRVRPVRLFVPVADPSPAA